MILILGARGQVARALVATANTRPVRSVGSETLDLRDLENLPSRLRELKPSAIINAAAYTKVDLAEKERVEAYRLNAEVPAVLAGYAADARIPLIHFSTDYVYSGEGVRPHQVGDPVRPCNYYGESKLAGEDAIRKSGVQAAILRTSWVYDEYGSNFVRTMLKLGAEREELKVVSDQIGAPTYAQDLAAVTWTVLEGKTWGTHHACGAGETSWHGFAEEIFSQAKTLGFPLKVERVLPVSSGEYKTAARRPLNSRMASSLIAKPWQISLGECLQRIKNEAN